MRERARNSWPYKLPLIDGSFYKKGQTVLGRELLFCFGKVSLIPICFNLKFIFTKCFNIFLTCSSFVDHIASISSFAS